mgnify:CR=1 FL=1
MTTDETTTTAREQALKDLRDVRERAKFKALEGGGRIRDEGKEKIRCQYLRVLVQACNAERRLLQDQDLEELADRVDAIENGDARSAVGTVRSQ